MKKLLVTITVFYFLLPATNAQLWKVRRLELTAGIGTTQFFGDIGGYPNDRNLLGLKDFTFRHTRLNINESIRYRITERWSARFNLTWGLLHSTDARGSNISRGFEENTYFLEYSFVGEYHLIRNKDEISYVYLRKNNGIVRSAFQSLDLYFFAGFGGMTYNVRPNGALSSRDQGMTNGSTEVLPIGLGLNMIYSDRINLGVELGGRFTNSDFIDGFSGLNSHMDVYHLLNFSITYKIRTENCVVR